MIGPLMRKMQQLGPIPEDERQRLGDLMSGERQRYEPGQDLARHGERPSDCKLITEGFVCRYKALGNGQRQIVSFHIPGDIVDLSSLMLGRMDHAVGAVTPVEAVAIPHATLRGWTERHPLLAQMLWRDTLIDAAVFREWVVNVGRRSALQRVAHLMCELVTRLRAAGLARGPSCELPLSCFDLSDATGLSAVHVNRTLQRLSLERLVEMRDQAMVVLNGDGLKRVADFDPAYLHHVALAA